MSDVTVVPGSVDDVRSIELRRQRDEMSMKLAMELAERGTAWVARDQGEPIGIAVVDASDDERYVGDLFVERSFRGQGIGSQLLDAAFADAGDAARTILLDISNAACLAMAMRRGIAPQTTVVRVAGAIPREESLAAMAAGDYRFEVGAIDAAAHAFALDALDRETRGTTRAGNHERFARDATGQAFFLNGEFVAYAYVWPDGRIGPLASTSVAYLVQILAFALVTLQRTYGASWCTTMIPGTNARLARAALRAGLRIEETFTIASDTPHPDLGRYVGHHRLLL